MLSGLRHGLRFFRVAVTLARYRALFPLEMLELPGPVMGLARKLGRPRKDVGGRPGERLAEALQSLGPSFIKLGQGLATRPDLVGHDVAVDLSALQDRLPPFSAEAARAMVESELDRPIADIFSEFTDEPVAAASIAQVHLAVTRDGRPVAVKILRPGIEARFAADFKSFLWLAEKVERRIPETRRLRPVEVVKLLRETVEIEMDFRLEAAAASELTETMADFPDYVVPAVDWQRTSRRVLTMDRVEGISLSHRDDLVAAGHDTKRLAAIVVQSFLRQSMEEGLFHADLHPGNLFADRHGRIVAIDFGIMGRLDRKTRRYLAQILLGILNRDYRGVARLHFEAGYVPPERSVAAFAQALRSVAEPIIGRPVQEISMARLLGQLFAITATFDMPTQPQLLLLQKTMVMVEGVAQTLDPEINMWETSRPVLEDWARVHTGPEAAITEMVETVNDTAQNLPKAIERLASGELAPRPVLDVSEVAGEIRRLRRLVFGLFIAVAVAAAGAVILI